MITASTAPFTAKVVERRGVTAQQRAERIVHRLDGLEHPATIDEVQAAGDALWSLCQNTLDHLDRVDYILGLDAGGIIPALGLAAASGLPYKIAWKLDLPLRDAVRFTEPHAMRRDVHAYHIEPGQRILLVDDEVTTGMTLVNLTTALRGAGAQPVGAACLIEDTRHQARTRLAASGITLTTLTRIEAACA